MPDGGKIDEFQTLVRLSDDFHRATVLQHIELDRGGVEAGQMVRIEHGHVKLEIEKRKVKERLDRLMFETALAALLADPVYRARHEAFGNFLDERQAAARTALERAIEVSEAAHAAVQDALNGTNMLDGRAVFVTKDGRIVYADGTEINPADAGRVEWRGGAKTYEEYLALIEAARAADATLGNISAFRERLETAREKWQSPDNPYGSVEEFDAEERSLEEDMPKSVREILDTPTQHVTDAASPTTTVKPDI